MIDDTEKSSRVYFVIVFPLESSFVFRPIFFGNRGFKDSGKFPVCCIGPYAVRPYLLWPSVCCIYINIFSRRYWYIYQPCVHFLCVPYVCVLFVCRLSVCRLSDVGQCYFYFRWFDNWLLKTDRLRYIFSFYFSFGSWK